MSEESYTDKVAARRAALPSAPVLDFVDYIKAVCGIEQRTLDKLRQQGIFLAAICGYALDRFPEAGGSRALAYGAWYYLKHRHETLPVLDEYQATDCLRIASYCLPFPGGLPVDDPRCIQVDYDQWTSVFPALCPRILNSSPEKPEFRRKAVLAIEGFAVDYPFRTDSLTMQFADQRDYAKYWVERSEEKFAPYLEDERFLAGLDAMGRGCVSHWGMLENIYGEDYEERILKPRGHALLDPLMPWLDLRAFLVLSQEVASGRRPTPSGLREKYPGFYDDYFPETWGRRERADKEDP